MEEVVGFGRSIIFMNSSCLVQMSNARSIFMNRCAESTKNAVQVEGTTFWYMMRERTRVKTENMLYVRKSNLLFQYGDNTVDWLKVEIV